MAIQLLFVEAAIPLQGHSLNRLSQFGDTFPIFGFN